MDWLLAPMGNFAIRAGVDPNVVSAKRAVGNDRREARLGPGTPRRTNRDPCGLLNDVLNVTRHCDP